MTRVLDWGHYFIWAKKKNTHMSSKHSVEIALPKMLAFKHRDMGETSDILQEFSQYFICYRGGLVEQLTHKDPN